MEATEGELMLGAVAAKLHATVRGGGAVRLGKKRRTVHDTEKVSGPPGECSTKCPTAELIYSDFAGRAGAVIAS